MPARSRRSGIILGHGRGMGRGARLPCETSVGSDVNILTLGQYLRPSKRTPARRPLLYARRVRRSFRELGLGMGFSHVQSEPAHPLVLPRVGAGRRAGAAAKSVPAPPAPRRPADGASSQGARATARPRSRPRGRVSLLAPPDAADPPVRGEARRGYSLGKIGGFCHLYIGQEAVAVGTLVGAQPRRLRHHTYRDHGHALARGMTPARSWPSCSARRRLRQAARAARCTCSTPSSDFLGGHGIVGGHIPLGTGVGLRDQVPRARDQVTRLLLRRGGGQQRRVPRGAEYGRAVEAPRDLHLREQPLRHGHGARARHRAPRRFEQGCAYDMARELVDGMDVLAVRATIERAVERARATRRRSSKSAPTVSWATRCPTPAITARAARSRDQERDPIAVWSQHLIDEGLMDQAAVQGARQGGAGGGGRRLPVRRPGTVSRAGAAVPGCVCEGSG